MNDDLDRIMDVMEVAFDPTWAEAWNRRQVSDSLAMPNSHYLLEPGIGESAAGVTLTRDAPCEKVLRLSAVRPELRVPGSGRSLL